MEGFKPFFIMKNAENLKAIIEPTVNALGFELWGCLYLPQGRHGLLRIYIDNEDGITVDDCERVSRQVSAMLDVENPIAGSYTLEVSSPGMDRPLFTKEQFERYIGAKINIRLHVPANERRHFSGRLQTVFANDLLVQADEGEFKIAFANIAKANVLPENVLPKKSREKRK